MSLPSSPDSTDEGPRPLPSPIPGEELWLTDRLLHVRRLNQGGAPALMIHGLGGSSLNWTDLGYEMAGRLDSWMPDLPGFGASPPPRDGDYSPNGHALAMYELVTQRIGEPVHVFGNSLGGVVATTLAARAPSWVRSLTLVAPALPGGRITTSNMHLPVIAVPEVGERLLARYMRAPAAWRTRGTIDVCFADASRMHPQRMAEAVAEVERRDRLTYGTDAFLQSARGLLRTMMDRGPNRPLALAGRVKCPVLLIYGRKDQLVDPAGAVRVARFFHDVRVMVLPDSGHVAQMEHPEMVADAWRELHPAGGSVH